MGLLGWAMSRFTGRWVGFKTIAETVESSASVNVNPHQLDIVLPSDFEMPRGRPQHPLAGSAAGPGNAPAPVRGRTRRSPSRAPTTSTRPSSIRPRARLGIVTTGKSYLDVLQALEYLGIDHKAAEDIGIRVYKVGMTWPLEPRGHPRVRARPRGHHRRRGEAQLHRVADEGADVQLGPHTRPSVVGKYDEAGEWILPSTNELTPARIARVIAKRLARFFTSEHITDAPGLPGREGSASWRCRAPASRAPRTTARAARTTPRPWCRKARARWPASAATTWSPGWTATPTPSPRWAAKARPGAARRRSPTKSTCSRTSATAPTSIPARWRSARRSRPRSTSPTRSSTTTRSR